MTTRNFLKTCLSLCLVFTLLAFGMTADAQQQAKRPYTEVILSKETSEPKAVEIAKKLFANDIDMMMQLDSKTSLKVNARFISLGLDKPKTSIIAEFEHSSVCGSQGCQVVVFMPTSENKYSIVFDNTIGRIFTKTRDKKEFYDLLTIDGYHTSGFGVFYWNDAKKTYTFSGISKFKK